MKIELVMFDIHGKEFLRRYLWNTTVEQDFIGKIA